MRNKMQIGLVLLLLGVLLGGCSRLEVPRADPSRALEDFSTRLRWSDIPGVAHYLKPEYQEAFRTQFAALEDLHITDVRQTTDNSTDPRHLETTVEIDFYQLPSLAIKTRKLHFAWEYVDLGRWQQGYWQITGPFPAFP